jgi:hypothetical protein
VLAQNPTKFELITLFKNSIEQDSRKLITTYSNPWFVDNGNESYYKSDTITLTNFINWNDLKICETVNWTFYKKDKFILTKAQHCKEPPSVQVSKEDDWCNIEISQNELGLFMKLYNNKVLMEEFKVLNIVKEPDKTKIILTRKRE